MSLFPPHSTRPPHDEAAAAPRRESLDTTATALLKRYRPLETRAAGGFGSVEVCLDVRLKRRVAIKRIPLSSPLSATPEDVRAQALAEARTAGLLSHPNIVSVIDFTYDADYAYLVMEYVDGMSLAEFLAAVDGHSLTYDECACIADALVQALAYAHENRVLHLDIKPANVMIDHSGHVKLTDFGMAKLASAAGFGGARGGTVGYMPPEQLAGEAVDERCDIFSLATVLYESLLATAPFAADTAADSLERIERGAAAPSKLLPDIPASAEEALMNAMAADPDERVSDVQAFGDAFLEDLGDARAGRLSLARIIERLCADDEDLDTVPEPATPAFTLDPAEGHLGSRSKHARAVVTGLISAAGIMATAVPLLEIAGVEGALARVLAAGVIALTGGVAPQIGSALITGMLALAVASRTAPLEALPTVAVIVAAFAGWWYVWGRRVSAASAAFSFAIGLAMLAGDAVAGAGPAMVFAACAAPPAAAGATLAIATIFAALTRAAVAQAGVLGPGAAIAALADPYLWAGVVLLAGGAVATSILLGKLWGRVQESRGTGLLIPSCLVPGIVILLLLCLANPMENGPIVRLGFVSALGFGALSSILVELYVYTLGYRKDQSEGDRL